jgi:hypothetical protein
MSETQSLLAKTLQQIQATLAKLTDQLGTSGVEPVGDAPKCICPPNATDEACPVCMPAGDTTPAETPVTAGPTADELRALAFELGYLEMFVKEGRKRWPSYTAQDLTACYNDIRKTMVAKGTWANRPGNKRRAPKATPQVTPEVTPQVEQDEARTTPQGGTLPPYTLPNDPRETNAVSTVADLGIPAQPEPVPAAPVAEVPQPIAVQPIVPVSVTATDAASFFLGEPGSGKTQNMIDKLVKQDVGKAVQAAVEQVGKKQSEIVADFENTLKAQLKTHTLLEVIQHILVAADCTLLEAKCWTDHLRGISDPTSLSPVVVEARRKYIAKYVGSSKPGLDSQVQTMRAKTTAKEMDAAAGKADGQLKRDIAGDNKNMLVQEARRIARTLAANGPVTIDDVTAEMSKRFNVLPVSGETKNAWKGSVFAASEWVYIGNMPSRQKSAHARPVGMWALKSWLKDNTLNGKDTLVSSFVLTRLYRDFTKRHPGVKMTDCNCFIGEDQLASEIRTSIINSHNRLYETPVTFIPGSVGAIMVAPVATSAIPLPTKT